MVNGGIIGLYVGAQHNAVCGEPREYLPHGSLGAAMAIDVRAARRHGSTAPSTMLMALRTSTSSEASCSRSGML